MRRREFITLLGGISLAWPRAASAQQLKMPVIGLLGAAVPDDAEVARNLAAFRQGLAETGYVEGQNVRIEYRWAEGNYERLPALAADLVARNVDVMVNEGGAPSVLAAKKATSTIPIVFHTSTDPVADDLIASLARPGGNLTGVSLIQVELSPKLLEFVSELVPNGKVIALLVNPNNSNADQTLRALQVATNGRGMQLRVLKAGTAAEIDAAFATLDRGTADALVVGADTFFTTQRDKIVALAARHSIAAIYTQGLFARAGGLVSYGPSLPAAYRLKGNYTGKILSGVKPADLPVQQPTTFELIINLTTAKTLGLTIPQTILAFANEVIE
jgi:putative ABC transport system substrate-binding protein